MATFLKKKKNDRSYGNFTNSNKKTKAFIKKKAADSKK